MPRTISRTATIALPLVFLAGCSLLDNTFGRKPAPEVPVAPPPPPQYAPPVATGRFTIEPEHEDVVGVVQKTVVGKDDTFSDIARRFNVGYEEMVRANPGVDPWLPGVGREVVVPTRFILPNAPRQGVVINLAAMRLWYFEPRKAQEPQVVHTYPIGIGRVGWATPEGVTKVSRKMKDPTWRPSAAVRKEHAENDDPVPAVVLPGPDNPLGNRALYLAWPSYLVHGTNKPYGVGIRSSHGCIRLYPEDILQLFELAPIGTPVRVVNQPYLFGWHAGKLYLQAYDVLEDDPRDFAKAPKKLLSKQLAARIQKELKARGETIDWAAVSAISHEPRGIPAPIAGGSASVAAEVAAAAVVENRVPEGANWDGVSGLPIDEKTFQDMFSDNEAEPAPAASNTGGAASSKAPTAKKPQG
ncbi:MAG TPA: L,D-transpeptidase family protein [Steroidobacteraceae bacterium]|nr:L,D-transpeptidase family protein [Steroidobacteraceae bacterium]